LRRHYPNLRVQINTPYDTFNIQDIDDIKEFCQTNIDFDQHLFYLLREDGVLISDSNTILVDPFLTFVQKHDSSESKVRGTNLWGRAVRALQSVTYSDVRLIKKGHKFIRDCAATRKFVTLYDDGSFTPCEVLASSSLGNIRDHDYDFYNMKQANNVNAFHKSKILNEKCNCDWMCAPAINMLYDPKTYLRIMKNIF